MVGRNQKVNELFLVQQSEHALTCSVNLQCHIIFFSYLENENHPLAYKLIMALSDLLFCPDFTVSGSNSMVSYISYSEIVIK